MSRLKRSQQQGFTLIELIVTMVVMGIMVMGIAGFIELGTKGYADTVDRQALQNQARFVVEKMTREIRHSVPNSFAVTEGGKCVSFYPIKYAGAYVVLPVSGGNPFRFVVVSAEPNSDDLNGLKLVVNPNRPDDLNTASSKSIFLSGVVKLKDSEGNDTPIYSTQTESDFDAGNVNNSVGNRLYLYNEKVQYCISSTTITRQENDEKPDQIGQNITSGSFNDGSGSDGVSLSRSGLIHMTLLFQRGDEKSQYDDDIQVLNVP
ncbi:MULTISPECIES: PilW family protein [Vibrio]|uniref:PilW family protein n=1 Tax=Vibrio TaxID=662 RepID=UPI000B5C5553|nr:MULTISPECIES: prepilin-type N-terminal cleavage/methylation domain-containing protein [Vibrio]HBV77196.1 prepilin-type N-terminal cleavage/methylation domain-containing protein [Vibrio sp.]